MLSVSRLKLREAAQCFGFGGDIACSTKSDRKRELYNRYSHVTAAEAPSML